MVEKIDAWLLVNKWGAPVIIASLVFAVFIWSLPNKFVLDDPSQVSNNAAVASFNLPYIFLGSSFGVGGGTEGIYYKPLMSTAYALVYKVFGPVPWGFHLLQVVLQMANGIIVYFIFRRFFKLALSLFLALVFVVHPFNSEAVLYISNLQDALFFFFGGLAFLAATCERLSLPKAVLSGGLVLFSLLSKETGVVFIPVIVMYSLLFNFGKQYRWEAWRLFMVLGTVFAFYFLLRFAAVGWPVGLDHPYPIMRLNLAERLVNVPAMIFYYVRNFFAPYDFAVAQHWVVRSVNWESFWLPLLVDIGFVVLIGGIGWMAWRARKYSELRGKKQGFTLQSGDPSSPRWSESEAGREKPCFMAYVFFLGWFGMGMVLHLNIFPLDVTVADRWFYFPSVGLLGMLGLLVFGKVSKVQPFSDSRKNLETLLVIVAVVLLIVLSARTFVRVFDWRDGLRLGSREVQYSKDSFPLENNLAYELIAAGRYQEALVHAKRSTELGPWWWLGWNNLGVIYRHLGYVQKDPKLIDLAIVSFGKGANNTGTFFQPHENLAETVLNFKQPTEAILTIEKTRIRMGLTPRMMFLLALAQYKDGDIKAASASAKWAVELGDEKAGVLYNGILNKQKIEIQETQY